jgi:pentatricopeptide repeat protein
VLVSFFCQKGFIEEAIELVELMMDYGCVPNLITYNTSVDGITKDCSSEDALELLHGLVSKGV